MYKKYQNVPVVEYPNNVKQNPIVSVCVQTYQHVNYIKQCLDGILMQKTDFPFEIILGEDASTDGTREICITYAKKYPKKIRLVLHERENNIKIEGVPSGRFNLLYNLSNAKGKYIAMCEGDDYWTDPLKLQKQLGFLDNNPEYGLAHTNFDRFYQINESFKRNFNKNFTPKLENYSNPFYGILIGEYVIITATVLCRSDLINNAASTNIFKNQCNLHGDLPLWLEILNHTRVKYLSESTAVHRVVKNSASHQSSIFKKLKYQESSKRIRLDFAKKYKVPKEIFSKVEILYYNVMLEKAYYHHDKELASVAYKKLQGSKSLIVLFKYLASKYYFLYHIINIVRKMRYGISNLGSFKEY